MTLTFDLVNVRLSWKFAHRLRLPRGKCFHVHGTLFTGRQQSSMLCRCPALAIAKASVCVSVTPCPWHCIKTTQAIITKSIFRCQLRERPSFSIRKALL